ncbi:RNA-binding protein 41-like [Mytilus galloprovincialis]|uniref:RNA-binding protein 41-like n=1 Tax=Mytilus galloprovincialis TaxID=29158 RepID=UPI003F7BCA89
MPGGSVNGRPFRESKDSFEKTGIPCGNPKRFHSQDVLRFSGQQTTKIKDLSGPVEDIETEAQRQLKTLLDKQLRTQTTLKEQLAQSRKFTNSTLYEPTTDSVTGIIDLSDYKALEEQDSRVNELRLCGLSDDEIRLKLQTEDGNVGSKKLRLRQEPSYLQDKLAEIDRKIETHSKSLTMADTFYGQANVGRHAMDLEKSLVKDSIDNKRLSSMLLKNNFSSDFPHPEHPMNHIPEILEEIAGKKLLNKKQHRLKQRYHTETNRNSEELFTTDTDSLDDVCSTVEEIVSTSSCQNKQENEIIGCKTREDSVVSVDIECSDVKQSHIFSELQTTKKPDNTSVNNKIVLGMVNQIPECDIIANRLSVDEIRRLPKFENYEEGSQNNVLYLKNLPNKISENELGSLFLRFQVSNSSPIKFRIMSGRMRGQAFVTFDSKETASEALGLVNGYKLHDNPIIIQYGKN